MKLPEFVDNSPDALIDLIGEFGREVYYLLDDCETSGPVGKEVHTITDESLTKVSAILDRIDALPFEEPGVILGTGAMLQAALETYGREKVREGMHLAATIAGMKSAVLPHYPDFTRGYAQGRSGAREAILAKMEKLK